MITYCITYSTPDVPCMRTIRHSQQAAMELVKETLSAGGRLIEIRVEE